MFDFLLINPLLCFKVRSSQMVTLGYEGKSFEEKVSARLGFQWTSVETFTRFYDTIKAVKFVLQSASDSDPANIPLDEDVLKMSSSSEDVFKTS